MLAGACKAGRSPLMATIQHVPVIRLLAAAQSAFRIPTHGCRGLLRTVCGDQRGGLSPWIPSRFE